MIWKPNTTVAAIIEESGKFLMVEENSGGSTVYNQPAGHLEKNETLVAAVVRETLEETAYKFVPQALVGIYTWHNTANDVTYLRFCFSGCVIHHDPTQLLDKEIVAAHWMRREELAARHKQLRSPMVMRCIDDYLAGQRYPLDVLNEL